ncbi:MAG: energy-coupling factor transporter transmembrane component T [candidate division Zixibacteria bacterium]|nr:energy-coupling factor transporter transmembrane component T [candidate division Zixibacteria bacterium]
MNQNPTVLLGQYRPLNSFLHKLDARAKIIQVVLLLILSLITNSIYFYVISFVLLISSLIISGVKFDVIRKNFTPIIIMVFITSLFHLIFTNGDSAELINIWGWSITENAVSKAMFFSMRMVLFISVAFLITLTSSPSDLAESFAKIFKPLSKLKIPIYEFSLIIFIAIRFIPVLYEEFTTIKNAQMMRGLTFHGSFKDRIKKISFILIPVFLAAINRADELADAIAVRGYGISKNRTYYSNMKFGIREILFTLISFLALIFLFWVTG